MGDQPGQIESIIHARVGRPQLYTVHGGMQGQVDLAAVPGIAQFIRRDRDRSECGPGLGLVETELLGQLCRYQVPE